MKRLNKTLAFLLAFSILISLTSCASTSSEPQVERIRNTDPYKPEFGEQMGSSPTDPGVTITPPPDDGINYMSMYIAYAGNEISDNNEIADIIAEKTGVKVKESYLNGITDKEAIDIIIASGDAPDFIDGGMYNYNLYANDMLVAWDPYLEEYPLLKELYTDEEWDKFRQDDGHIYWANILDNPYMKDTSTIHNGLAFWIQVRVLEWAGYPQIETLDEYFELLERYAEANPTMPDGSAVIPYTCISESWRNYALEEAPMLLDGYPDNRCVIVNTDDGINNPKVVDYNTTDTARAYFAKLNEEYNKGVLDPDFAVQTYDEYISKLSTGRVLGMCDQYWDFAYMVGDVFQYDVKSEGGQVYTLSDIGCDYVPLGLVAENGMEQRYHTYRDSIDYSSGIAVTTSCIDPELAFKFLNDLLSQEIHDLRFWGIEGVDYLVDENGLYYRTIEMNNNWKNPDYLYKHCCKYSYMPQHTGMSRDGKNRNRPEQQPSIFKATLPEDVAKCFDTYVVDNYVEFLGSVYVEPEPWYPMWTWSNELTTSTAYGTRWMRMNEIKAEWLPQVVISADFDSAWNSYMEAYENCEPEIFLDAAQAEVNKRLAGT